MSKYKDKVQKLRPRLDIVAQSENQAAYLKSMQENVVTVGLGFAGSGKTYLAASEASAYRLSNPKGKVIICRPNVSDSRSIGYLPGSELEKLMPWASPYLEVMKKHLGPEKVSADLGKSIDIVAFEHLQGRSLEDAFVMVDEAQHATQREIELLLKRVGQRCTMVISGDIAQAKLGQQSGLKMLLDMRNDSLVPEVREWIGFTEFNNPDDIVRSEFCKNITMAFSRWHDTRG
jgi:phosphate starvation-inducible PhoH-like protein